MPKQKSKMIEAIEILQEECLNKACNKCELEKFCDAYLGVGPYKWIEVIEGMKVKK